MTHCESEAYSNEVQLVDSHPHVTACTVIQWYSNDIMLQDFKNFWLSQSEVRTYDKKSNVQVPLPLWDPSQLTIENEHAVSSGDGLVVWWCLQGNCLHRKICTLFATAQCTFPSLVSDKTLKANFHAVSDLKALSEWKLSHKRMVLCLPYVLWFCL